MNLFDPQHYGLTDAEAYAIKKKADKNEEQIDIECCPPFCLLANAKVLDFFQLFSGLCFMEPCSTSLSRFHLPVAITAPFFFFLHVTSSVSITIHRFACKIHSSRFSSTDQRHYLCVYHTAIKSPKISLCFIRKKISSADQSYY